MKNPVLWMGLMMAVLAALPTFGVPLTPVQMDAIKGVGVAILAIVLNQQVVSYGALRESSPATKNKLAAKGVPTR